MIQGIMHHSSEGRDVQPVAQQHVLLHMLLGYGAKGQDILKANSLALSMSCPITGNTLTRLVMTVKAQ